MAFVTGMTAGALAKGLDITPVLHATGIDLADPDKRIPLADYAAFYNRLVSHLDDEGFALFSRPLPCGTFEFLCRSVSTAANLAEALHRASRFLRIVLPDFTVDVLIKGETACLRLQENIPPPAQRSAASRVFAFEWLLRLLHGLACWLVGRSIALDEVSFPYPRPAHADDYPLIYSAQCSFDSQALRATFRANLLELPIRRDEAALNAFLVDAPGKITTIYRRDREMVSRVRDLLRAALPELPDQESIAARLFMSARTLHRRLEEEGSSFRAIKDALRRDIALTRLSKSDLPIAGIAAELGYADTSTFYRACLEWTGLSPREYRQQRR